MTVSNKEIRLKELYHQISFTDKIPFQDFKSCFEHISMHESKGTDDPGNSRYVFLGMYAFRGFLAELCEQYIGGNGKQLQQYLGNIFTNARLEKLFDSLGFAEIVSIHESLELKSYRHIFAQAFLGLLYKHAEKEYLQELAYTFFLDDTSHLLPKTASLNIIQLLKLKSRAVMGQSIKIITSKDAGNQYHTEIKLEDGSLISSHSSRSKTYAKKKAVKLALRRVLDEEAKSPAFIEAERKRLDRENNARLREKALKQKTHQERILKKQEERALIREQKRKEAKEREIRRVLNKENAKKRKKKDE